jgi:hypothetical protein
VNIRVRKCRALFQTVTEEILGRSKSMHKAFHAELVPCLGDEGAGGQVRQAADEGQQADFPPPPAPG